MSVFIIAEAGVNHNGSLEIALKLVDAAADAGADAVKFQTFTAETLVAVNAPKAAYQKAATGADQSQYLMLKDLELGADAFRAIAVRCRERGIEFMSTAFDAASLDLLLDIGLERLKVPSGDVTNAPLLLRMARAGLPLVLSTGMCTLGDVENALGVVAYGFGGGDAPGERAFAAAWADEALRAEVRKRVVLLHCTTSYPTPLEDVNLRAMDTLASAFGLPVGYSDHTQGFTVPVAAAARGASVLEKHFTLDRALPGPDHAASLEPDELAAMVCAVREVGTALGASEKKPTAVELGNAQVARKSLVAACDIAEGEVFDAGNLAVKRPGGGLAPVRYWELLGRLAGRAYGKDEPIDSING